MLEVSNLSKAFGDVQAVKNLSFKVNDGTVLGIIGPNGAGKTTAIECICTILEPDSGTVYINGHEIFSEQVLAKQHLAYVPEIPYPYSNLTVKEHIEFTARIFQMKNWEARADELIKRFDLEDKKDKFTDVLSKGQKQKLNLICAFIHEPKVMLLDEPLYGIDPNGGKVLKDLVRSARARGASIVISSHMLSLVEELADKILILSDGVKVAEGPINKVAQEVELQSGSKLEDIYIKVTKRG